MKFKIFVFVFVFVSVVIAFIVRFNSYSIDVSMGYFLKNQCDIEYKLNISHVDNQIDASGSWVFSINQSEKNKLNGCISTYFEKADYIDFNYHAKHFENLFEMEIESVNYEMYRANLIVINDQLCGSNYCDAIIFVDRNLSKNILSFSKK